MKSELSSSERPELTSAPIVISGGRGMQDGSELLHAGKDSLFLDQHLDMDLVLILKHYIL